MRTVQCTNYIANIQRIINEIQSLAPRFLADSELGFARLSGGCVISASTRSTIRRSIRVGN